MNLQDQVIYRCIQAACARPMPRRVDFCPYCGSAQHEGALRPAAAVAGAPPPARMPTPTPEPLGEPAAEASAAPAQVQHVPPAPPAPPAPLPEAAAGAPAQPAGVVTPSVVTPSAAPPGVAARPAPSGPALRKPIRLRYWLMTLAVLAGIWYTAKPAPKKIEARIEQATLQAEDCNLKEARAALEALRGEQASAAQLQRLQSSINAAAAACERKRARAGKARNVPRRETAALPPKSAPAPLERQAGQSAHNLIAEAERELAQGNYKAASDKLETCIAMLEGSSECAAYKKHADRLLREKQRCMAAGRDWTSERCL
jgi:hypothetical protein